jgi:hypothetical protein
MDKGLYIENLDLTIPWKTSLDEIEDYGQPEIIVHSDQRTDAIWVNVKIFGGLTLDLTSMFWQTLFGRNKFDNAHAYIDKKNFEKFKPHLDKFFNQIADAKKKNELEYYYRWTSDKCKITLGQGDRFGTYYYLDIKRKNWL